MITCSILIKCVRFSNRNRNAIRKIRNIYPSICYSEERNKHSPLSHPSLRLGQVDRLHSVDGQTQAHGRALQKNPAWTCKPSREFMVLPVMFMWFCQTCALVLLTRDLHQQSSIVSIIIINIIGSLAFISGRYPHHGIMFSQRVAAVSNLWSEHGRLQQLPIREEVFSFSNELFVRFDGFGNNPLNDAINHRWWISYIVLRFDLTHSHLLPASTEFRAFALPKSSAVQMWIPSNRWSTVHTRAHTNTHRVADHAMKIWINPIEVIPYSAYRF